MSIPTGPQLHLEKRRRARIAALVFSLAAHTAVAGAIVWTMDKEKVGSQELDIELVAPRLATPLDPAGQEAEDPGRARRDGESETAKTSHEERSKASAAQAAQAAQASAWQRKLAAAEKAASISQKQDAERRDKRTQQQAEQNAARAEQELKKQREKKQAKLDGDAKRKTIELAEDPAASLARLQQQAFEQQTQLAAATEALPDGPSLNRLVDDVRQDRAARAARRKRALEAHKQQRAALERRFSALAHRTEVLASASLTSGRGIIGESATTGVLRVGGSARRGGKTPRYGLKFYLSGRRVEHSKVVQPPELIKAPRLKCKVTSLSITPATVRMLVEKSGKVGHTYLKHSSGNRFFDRCSIEHAQAMVFRPGVDQLGAPLDVWINVRVEPSTLTAQAY